MGRAGKKRKNADDGVQSYRSAHNARVENLIKESLNGNDA